MNPFTSSQPVAKKRFGQHFLHDPNVIARMIRAMNPQPGEDWVEIGPGLGALTGPLLERAQRLRVVEIDRDLPPQLRAALGDPAGLEIVLADALTVDFAALAGNGAIRLAGNLPYNISSPLLFHVLDSGPAIRDMHFMLQKEVVDRICAGPGEDAYGRLSVAVAARAEAIHLFDVGPGAFRPPPKVDSAIVRIVPRPAPFAIDNWAEFERVVAAAFSKRRKQLANGLKGLLDADAIRAAGVDPQERPEQLAPAQFAALANLRSAQLAAEGGSAAE